MADQSRPEMTSSLGLQGPTLYLAELASGASGGVIQDLEIDFDRAVTVRKAGGNVVVCGEELKLNRALALMIETAVGACMRNAPHKKHAGPRALPHFQQQDPEHEGHTFYETPQRKAMRRK